MAAQTEPLTVVAGDTVSWTKTLPDYPAPAWTLTYTLINAAAKITITATASGTDHLVHVLPASTATWPPGRYEWLSRVSDGTDQYTVDHGVMDVAVNIAAQTTYDGRSAYQQALDEAEAALRTYGSKAWMQSYSISGRSQTFQSAEAFLNYIDRLRALVKMEAASTSQVGLKNQLYVRFRGT